MKAIPKRDDYLFKGFKAESEALRKWAEESKEENKDLKSKLVTALIKVDDLTKDRNRYRTLYKIKKHSIIKREQNLYNELDRAKSILIEQGFTENSSTIIGISKALKK